MMHRHVGAGPASLDLAGQHFRRFNKIRYEFCARASRPLITAGPQQKSFLY